MSEDLEAVQYACASCGQMNRIPRRRLYDDPKCGSCHEKVFPRRPVEVGQDTWKAEVEECPIPVLVDFWAEWCAPCRAVAPILEQVAEERAGRLKIAKLNVDQNQRIAAQYGIQAIPTLLVFRGPLLVDQIAGALGKEALDVRLSRVV